MRSNGHTSALCLLLAVASDGGVARAQPSGIPPAVAPPVVEQGAGATTEIGLPGGPSVRLRASSGTFDAPVAASGAWTVRYRPGEPVEPGWVIFHASREACGGTWAIAPRAARAVQTLRTKPRASVTIAVGDRIAGTGTADEQGRVTVVSRVLPGDTRFEVRAVDTLGNENRRVIQLPEPASPPPLLVEACADGVRAGESVLVEVAATDPAGTPRPVQWSGPPEAGVWLVGTAGVVSTYRVQVEGHRQSGPLRLEVRNGTAVATVELRVQGVEVPAVAARPERPAPPGGDGSGRHAGPVLSGDTGAGSNLGGQWGTSSSVAVAWRPARLSGRLVPRLGLSVDALWGNGPYAAAVRALGTSLEIGVGATVLRVGPWDVDLQAGLGAGWARVVEEGTVDRDGRWLPSLSAALAVRRVLGRGALVARLGWRQRFRDSDASDAEASGNRGIATLTVGGEIDL